MTICSVVFRLFVILVISQFGFEGWSWVLIASVPDLCILFTFIGSVPDPTILLCLDLALEIFPHSLTQESNLTKHDEMIGIYTDKLPRSKLSNSITMATDPAIDYIMSFEEPP